MQALVLALAFIFLGLWYVLKLATDRVRNQPPPGQRPPRPLMRPEARPGPLPRPQAEARDPREEVAEFLRRAQMRRAEPQPPKQRKTSSAERRKAVQQAQQQPREAPRRETPSKSRPKPPPLAPEPAIVLENQPPSARRLVSEPLGSDIRDRQVQGASEDPYAHKPPLTSMEETGSSPASGGAKLGSASSLAEALRNPARIRDAIVLGEVLSRPEHRWD